MSDVTFNDSYIDFSYKNDKLEYKFELNSKILKNKRNQKNSAKMFVDTFDCYKCRA